MGTLRNKVKVCPLVDKNNVLTFDRFWKRVSGIDKQENPGNFGTASRNGDKPTGNINDGSGEGSNWMEALEFVGQRWKKINNSEIWWTALKLSGKTWISTGRFEKVNHDSEIWWAILKLNGQIWNQKGNPGKIDYESQLHEASLKLNGKAWNLPGKLANFLEIDEFLLKPSKKHRNHQNS